MIENILDNRSGQIIISIILGLGLSVIFSSACIGRNCYIIKGPDPNSIKEKVYQFDKQCYQFNPYVSGCKKKNSIKSDSLLI
jgi:hypothetical protein